MIEGYEEDLDMYEEARGPRTKQLDNRVLLRPISDLDYPTKPAAVGPEAQVGEALATMGEKNIGALLVVEDGKVVGIFGERDPLIKNLYDGTRLERPVREFMTPDPDCLTPEDSIAFALNRMVVGGYRHIPLVNPAHEPVGILVMRDVVGYVVSFFPAEVLNAPPHSEHDPPDRQREGG